MNTKNTAAGTAKRRGGMKRVGRKIMWYLVLGYALWCALLYVAQDRMLFLPRQAAAPLPAPPEGVECLTVPLDRGGVVEAWFFPAPGANSSAPAPAVVFFHGNAELIDHQDPIVAGYRRLGVSVLLPEYRGYGRSAGKPSQTAILQDNLRFLDMLAKRPDVDPKRIVYHGRSLGGGPACDLAAHREPAALVLESTFASVASMARKYLVPTVLAKHPFRNDRVVGELAAPALILHGSRDRVIPVRHGRKLKRLAPDARYVEFDAGHNDFPGEGNEQAYWEAVGAFLAEAEITGP